MKAVAAIFADANIDVGRSEPEAAAEWAEVKRRAMNLKPERVRWPLASQMERPQVISSKTCVDCSKTNPYFNTEGLKCNLCTDTGCETVRVYACVCFVPVCNRT